MHRPSLRMALVGFRDLQEPQNLLRARTHPAWETAPLDEADAIWVAGSSARLEADSLVRVWNGDGKAAVVLHLNTLERPLTFTHPLTDMRLQDVPCVDLHSPASVEQALRRTEQALRAVQLQLAMAHQIASRLASLTAHTYHVILNEKLVAVVSVPGRIGIELSTEPDTLAGARWIARPAAANDVPKWFLPTSFAECLWLYAGRTQTELLPRRYRTAPLYFRAVPKVPQRLIQNRHYALLAELAAGPQTFAALQQSVGLSEEELAAALTALYFSGSVTVNPERASRSAAGALREAASISELRNSMFPGPGPRRRGLIDATMPASLEGYE